MRVYVNGTVIKGIHTDDDLYDSIDKVTSILAKQLTKHKEKLRDNRHGLPHIENTKQIVFEPANDSITFQTVKKLIVLLLALDLWMLRKLFFN